MKVAILAGSNQQCGIYVYSDRLRQAFKTLEIEADLVSSPEALHSRISLIELDQLARSLSQYDLLINEHEPGLWGNCPRVSGINLSYFAKALKGRVRHVLQLHTMHHSYWWNETTRFPRKQVFQFFMNQIWGSVDQVIVHEERARQGVMKAISWASPKSTPIVQVHDHPCPSPRLRQAHRTFDDIINLGTFGFLTPYKGHRRLIELFAELPTNYRLRIVGGAHSQYPLSQSYLKEIEQLIESMGLQDRVGITGWLSEDKVADQLSDIDVAVLPYIGEDLSASGAIRELLSYGIPVLASDIPAFQGIEKKTKALTIFDRNDFGSFERALEHVLSDYNTLSEDAFKFCQSNSYEHLAGLILSEKT